MEFQELKRRSYLKVLFRGKSGTGKTLRACEIALTVSSEGGRVLFVDTEAEGSTTMVNLIESGRFEESDVENIDYVRVDNYEQLVENIDADNQEKYDLLVVDTLDHKHSYSLKKVTGDSRAADADWNQYPEIYTLEKDVMEMLNKPRCNVIATIDPESGKIDKPKGTQTNVHGYFSVVADMFKQDDGWSTRVRNWVGKSEAIGKSPSNLDEALAREMTERM